MAIAGETRPSAGADQSAATSTLQEFLAVPALRRRRGVYRRLAIWGLEAAGVALLLVILAGFGLAIALWNGPLDIGFAKPFLQRAVALRVGEGSSAAIGRVVLVWERQDQALRARIDNLAIRQDNQVLAAVERSEVDLRLGNWLLGRPALSRLWVVGGRLEAQQDASGAWRVAFFDLSAREEPESAKNPLDLAQSLFGAGGPLRSLREIGWRDALLEVTFANGAKAAAALPEATANLSEAGLDIGLAIDASAGPADAPAGEIEAAKITATLHILPDFRGAAVDLHVVGASPYALMGAQDENRPLVPPWFASIDSVIEGVVSFGYSLDAGLLSANATITAAPGAWRGKRRATKLGANSVSAQWNRDANRVDIALADLAIDQIRLLAPQGAALSFPGLTTNAAAQDQTLFDFRAPALRLAVDEGGELQQIANVFARGALDLAESALALEQIEFGFGAARLTGKAEVDWSARADGAAQSPRLKANFDVEGALETAQVIALWPPNAGSGAYDWVSENLQSGMLTKVNGRIDLPAGAIVRGPLPDEAITIGFDFSDAVVRIADGFPLLRGVHGSAVLRGNRFDLRANGAQADGLTLTTGSVALPKLVPKGALAEFRGRATGEAKPFLSLLAALDTDGSDTKRLLDASISGTGALDFQVTRPMLTQVPREDYGFDVRGAFSNVLARDLIGDQPLEKGEVDVAIKNGGFLVEADFEIGAAPAHLRWEQRDGAIQTERTALAFSAQVSAETLDEFGFGVREFVQGNVAFDFVGFGDGLALSRGEANIDLTPARAVLPLVNWEKEPQIPGSAILSFSQTPEGALTVNSLTVNAPNLRLNGGFELAADGKLLSAAFDEVKIGDNVDVDVRVARNPDFTIDLRGARLDGRGFLAGVFGGGGGDVGLAAPVALNVDLARLQIGDSDQLENVQGALRLDQKGLQTADLTARHAGQDATFSAQREADGAGGKFAFIAPDSGLVARIALGLANADGGRMRLDGAWSRDETDALRIAYQAEAKDVRIRKAPGLAKILALGSLRALSDLANGDGILFERLEAEGALQGGRLMVDEARAVGPGMGLTVQGLVDLDDEALALSGAIIPSYGLNAALGAVPVLGDIFVSRPGEGVFAIVYKVDGTFEETKITVNPLSAAAPGVFRRIFEPIRRTQANAAAAARKQPDQE